MTTERRQSSPEYRERVGQAVEVYVQNHDHDYDAALDTVERHARQWPSTFHNDVLSLLRRRAETVKGMRVP